MGQVFLHQLRQGTVLQERLPIQVVLIYAILTFKSTIIGSMRPHLKA